MVYVVSVLTFWVTLAVRTPVVHSTSIEVLSAELTMRAIGVVNAVNAVTSMTCPFVQLRVKEAGI